jgi:hypothetical protein
MSVDIVNLRQFRKRKLREAKEQEAAANREAFGESKTTRRKREQEAKREAARLEDHKREE